MELSWGGVRFEGLNGWRWWRGVVMEMRRGLMVGRWISRGGVGDGDKSA